MVKLRGFFDNERDVMERSETRPSFIRKYTEGQLNLFWDMMERMIVSKNHAIYEQINKEKEDRIAGIGDIGVDEIVGSEVEDAIMEEDEEDKASDGQSLAPSTVKNVQAESEEVQAAIEAAIKKRKRKLKQSGCLTAMYIDPDVSDDEDDVIKRMRKAEEAANTAKRLKEEAARAERAAKLGIVADKAMTPEQKAENEAKKAAENEKKKAAAAKEQELKALKEKQKGLDRRKFYMFLIKHGLTEKEAYEYTQLTKDFNIDRVPLEQREYLRNNFAA